MEEPLVGVVPFDTLTSSLEVSVERSVWKLALDRRRRPFRLKREGAILIEV